MISSSSCDGDTPAWSSVAARRSVKSRCSNSVGEMLTAMRARLGRIRSRVQPAMSQATVEITRSLTALIAPVASAVGMKTDGGIGPSTGWCQRTSASAMAMDPVRRSMIGW